VAPAPGRRVVCHLHDPHIVDPISPSEGERLQ
jgi:hypothetical protein